VLNEAELLNLFNGRQVLKIFNVVVDVDQDKLELPDTVILSLDDGLVQMTTDATYKLVKRLSSPEDVELCGDYDDRTGIELREHEFGGLPFEVGGLYIVRETLSTPNNRYPVGIFFLNNEQQIVLGVRIHLDDIEVGTGESLWQYVWRILPHSCGLEVTRLQQ
jgi:hypothetical protein